MDKGILTNAFICIYGIYNIVSNKIYVGSTVDLLRRKEKHIRFLRQNEHKNKKLQNAYNKHKEQSFCFFVLEDLNSQLKGQSSDKIKKILAIKEQIWFESCKKEMDVYNIRIIASSNYGLKHTKAARKAISECNKKRVRTEESKKKTSDSMKKYHQDRKCNRK